jgi:MFS family permease
MAENASFYIYSAFVLVYATRIVKLDRDHILSAVLVASLVELVAIPIFGALSDRWGRRPVYLFGAIFTAVWAYPLFRLFDTASLPLIYLALIVAFVFSHAAMYGPQGAFLSELFGTRVRYSGASLGAQLSSIAAGGAAPLIAVYILDIGYGRGMLALYIIAMAVITVWAVLAAHETAQGGVEH